MIYNTLLELYLKQDVCAIRSHTRRFVLRVLDFLHTGTHARTYAHTHTRARMHTDTHTHSSRHTRAGEGEGAARGRPSISAENHGAAQGEPGNQIANSELNFCLCDFQWPRIVLLCSFVLCARCAWALFACSIPFVVECLCVFLLPVSACSLCQDVLSHTHTYTHTSIHTHHTHT